MPGQKNLVIVACHSIYKGKEYEDIYSDDSWYLKDFQKDEPKFYIEHILTGIKLANNDSSSVLIFSGGFTNPAVPFRSEAMSYYELAESQGWLDKIIGRLFLEEYARDSFENLLFGLCKFYELAGKLPEKTTMVSWKFKKARFNFHWNTLSINNYKFEFYGVNNPEDLSAAIEGEKKAIAEFKISPYGIKNNLKRKKQIRNPFNRKFKYDCPIFTYTLNLLKSV
ncbi:MAG: hypothetical protein JW917_07870 [Ignavibacteria bacterium]|nr:hypothetical protein [Ignavibacteria bacterium]